MHQKVVVREKFSAIQAYHKKQEKSPVNSFTSKATRKRIKPRIKVSGSKINTQKSVAFIYTNNKL